MHLHCIYEFFANKKTCAAIYNTFCDPAVYNILLLKYHTNYDRNRHSDIVPTCVKNCGLKVSLITLTHYSGILSVPARISFHSNVRTLPHTLLIASTVQIIDVYWPCTLRVPSIPSLRPLQYNRMCIVPVLAQRSVKPHINWIN